VPDWSTIHRQKKWGPWTPPLACCSAVYSVAVQMRLGAYKRGLCKGRSLPGFTVSVGNLTAGGTGKTPAVVMLGRWAREQGKRVSVLSRGYGAQGGQDLLEVSDGKRMCTDVRLAGDEPSLIAREVPGVSVIVSHSRYRAGMYAHKRFGADFFILDDGFQHLGLKRDLDLLLMDAKDPIGNGHLLPWGPLREPMKQIKRADAVILTRAGDNTEASKRPAFLRDRFPSMPVFRADHQPHALIFPHSEKVCPPEFLNNKRVAGFAGIAHPEYFKKTLGQLGADVVEFTPFKDHYPFTPGDVERLIRLKNAVQAHYLVTTEKDWMRIASLGPADPYLAYLCIRFRLLPGHEGVFRMIQDGLN
jgi:tetraacyldisaccharide 4'-kinase